MSQTEHYTFGDSDLAAERLRILARVFEPGSTKLLRRLGHPAGALALDLGCGPGYTTRLLAEHTNVTRVLGLDQSSRLIERANTEHRDSRLSFAVADITCAPLPAPPSVVLYSRFLLTHLQQPEVVVVGWGSAVERDARLVLEETAFMNSEHPALRLYYGLVERMQRHYGQRMYMGRDLAELAARSAPDWVVEFSEVTVSPLPAQDMARLHALNLRTWSEDPFARAEYAETELRELGDALERIALGEELVAPVSLGMGQIILRRS